MNTNNDTYSLTDLSSSPFTPLSRSQILSILKASQEQIDNGEYLDFEEALCEIETGLGIHHPVHI